MQFNIRTNLYSKMYKYFIIRVCLLSQYQLETNETHYQNYYYITNIHSFTAVVVNEDFR